MASLLLIVTGASRGLGQAFATAFVKNETSGVSLASIRALLVSRSTDGLVETEQQMTEAAAGKPGLSLDISKHAIDLANVDNVEKKIDDLLEKHVDSNEKYQSVVLINNAGTLGHLGPCTGTNFLDLQRSIDLNITSSIWLSARFVREMKSSEKKMSSCVVVNVSSLCALEAFPTMAAYCAGRAARDMYHSTLAKEHKHDDRIKILNYAPGPCETDMTKELSESDALDKDVQMYYRTSRELGTLVKPQDTSRRLVELVLQKEFESGAHIDYFDLSDT